MLITLKTLSTKRSFWLFLIFSVLALEGAAVYFQYGMGLAPCVMCVYERAALFVILGACVIGILAPQFLILRLLSFLIGIISALKGLAIALKHTDYQLHPGPWNQCSAFAEFPKSLPLDSLIPSLFHPYGECSDVVWSFLGLSMAQWLIVIFAGYLVVFIILLISQLAKITKKRMIFTR